MDVCLKLHERLALESGLVLGEINSVHLDDFPVKAELAALGSDTVLLRGDIFYLVFIFKGSSYYGSEFLYRPLSLRSFFLSFFLLLGKYSWSGFLGSSLLCFGRNLGCSLCVWKRFLYSR